MALPFKITNLSIPEGHFPPFKSSGGNFYVIASSSGNPSIFKATDPTDAWVKQDAAGEPTTSSLRGTAVQNGDIIHMVGYTANAVDAYHYNTFDMSIDEWVVTDEVIDTPNNTPTIPWSSVAVRANGEVVAVFNGDTDQVMGGKKERVDMRIRSTGGTWSSATALDAAGDIHYMNPVAIKSSDTDDIHIRFLSETDTADPPVGVNGGNSRTVDTSDTLSTVVTDTDVHGSYTSEGQNAVAWDDAGTERVLFSGTQLVVRKKEDGSGDIANDATAVDPVDGTLPRFGFPLAPIVSLAIDRDDDSIHIVWGNATDGDDIYYNTSTDKGATWGTKEELVDAIFCSRISATVYTRGTDTVLAYLYYANADGVYYNEKVLSSAGLSLLPTGIASAESIGSPTVAAGAVDLSPTGIASTESFGSPVVTQPAASQDLTPTGIASAESFGTHAIQAGALIAPDVLLSSTGFTTCVVADIESIDANFCEATSNDVDTEVHSSFTDPTGFPTTGVGLQTITAEVRLNAASGTGTPTARIEVYEDGSLVVAGSNENVTSSDSQIIELDWDAVLLISPNGRNVEAKIITTKSGGAAEVRASVDVGNVEWVSAEEEPVEELLPTGIVSAESIGSPTITTTVGLSATGIASQESIGSPVITTTVDLAPTGIATAESIGSPVITTGAVDLAVTGIPSAESFGNASIATGGVTLTATGIGSSEAFGVPVVTTGEVILTPSGIASEESIGSPVLTTGAVNLTATGISSAESFGSPVITSGGGLQELTATGIPSAESFGAAVVTTGSVDLATTGIVSVESIGTPTITTLVTLSPTGIPSEESLGNAVVTTTVNLDTTGITSTESIGSPTITTGAVNLAVTGIASEEAFGVAVVSLGGVVLQVPSIGSTESIGSPSITVGAVDLSPTGIPSEESFGSPTVAGVSDQFLTATGIASSESFGNHTLVLAGDKIIKIDFANSKVLNNNLDSTTLYFNGKNYFTI